MPAKRAKPKKSQPTDGELTMRQAVAARVQAKFAEPISWQFGHASFQTGDGRVFCFITRDGNLALKLPEARIAPLLEAGAAKPLRMGARTMREWALIPDPDSGPSLKLLREARIYVESLPASPPKPKATAKRVAAKQAAATKAATGKAAGKKSKS